MYRDLFTTPKIHGRYCVKTSSVRGNTNELLPDTTDYPINYDEYVTNTKKTISIVREIAAYMRGAHSILCMWKSKYIIVWHSKTYDE